MMNVNLLFKTQFSYTETGQSQNIVKSQERLVMYIVIPTREEKKFGEAENRNSFYDVFYKVQCN